MWKLTHGSVSKGQRLPPGLACGRMNPFPSMKSKRLLAVLERQPLGYVVVRRSGSHRRMESPHRPPLTFAFHDGATIPAGLVRKILIKDVGLDEEEARKLL
jgi:predicted RNA binding protein YcfA (HicA-like mRNA interferase family)